MMWWLLVVLASPAPMLSLQDAVQIAQRNQPRLQQARAESDAADARGKQARANLLPQLTGTLNYQRTTSNFVLRPGAVPNNFTAPAPTFDTFNFFAVGVTVNQLIYDFGQTIERWRAAKALTKAQQVNERAVWQQVLFDVRSSFFAARAAKALVGVARDTLANQEKHLHQIEGFVAVGTRPEIDVAQARTDRANSQVQVIQAENSYVTAKARLNQAMGREQTTDYEITDDTLPALENEDAEPEELLSEAERRRPDLLVLQERLRAQELTVRSLIGGYAPTLGLSSTFSDAGSRLNDLGWNWNVSVGLTWPLFQGGLTMAQVQEARANALAVRSQINTLRLQLRYELEQARSLLRAAKATLDYADDALFNARERLRLAEGRYETGVGLMACKLASAGVGCSFLRLSFARKRSSQACNFANTSFC